MLVGLIGSFGSFVYNMSEYHILSDNVPIAPKVILKFWLRIDFTNVTKYFFSPRISVVNWSWWDITPFIFFSGWYNLDLESWYVCWKIILSETSFTCGDHIFQILSKLGSPIEIKTIATWEPFVNSWVEQKSVKCKKQFIKSITFSWIVNVIFCVPGPDILIPLQSLHLLFVLRLLEGKFHPVHLFHRTLNGHW